MKAKDIKPGMYIQSNNLGQTRIHAVEIHDDRVGLIYKVITPLSTDCGQLVEISYDPEWEFDHIEVIRPLMKEFK